ncbi:MAG TPA: carboxylesterase family protein [Myxococcota bacterium]|nr:carboxylesterase family protein [Myxococcota bacterium]
MRKSALVLGFLIFILGAVVLVALGLGRGRAPHVVERTADPDSKRTISSGELVGFAANEKSQGWLGIPFAAPPVADLRWRPPRPPAPWSGTRESLRAGSPCMQVAGLLSGTPELKPGSLAGNEDCLYLNVYAPRASASEAKLHHWPVMFWIHGGGNTVGRGDGYDGSELAAAYDVVVVTVNYRLGPFGWFRHPALVADAADDDGRSGNWGTLDLIQALKWVRAEIPAFGGDSQNVTIFGESAGGVDVYSLLVSPRAAGLFQRAISESGGLNGATLAKAQNPKSAAEPGDERSSAEVTPHVLFPELEPELAQKSVAELSAGELAAKLRAASPDAVFAAYRGEGQGFGGMLRMPLVIRDGAVLPQEEIEQRLADGHYNQVPVITGTNRDELKLFMFGDRSQVTWWFGFLPRIKDVNHYDVSAEYGTLGWKMGAVDSPARDMRNVQGPSVYAYRFDWDEEPKLLWSDFSVLLGAAHGLEIPFVFKNFRMEAFERMWTEQNRAGREELADAMSSYWAQFAYSGSPGRGRAGDLPEWKAWDNADGADKGIVFDTHAGGGIRMERQAVTKESVLAKMAGDSRMDDKLRCEIFQGYVDHDAFTAEDLPKSGCKKPAKDVAER